jgi:hypothetical protein
MLKIPKVVGESLAPGEVVEWTAYGIRPIESRTAYLPLLIGAAIGFAIHQTTGILNSALMIGLGCGAGQLVDLWREDDKLRGEGDPGGAQTRLVLTSGRFLVVGRPALLGLTWSKVEHALERNEVASISLSERNLGHDHHHSTPSQKSRSVLTVELLDGRSWQWAVAKPLGTLPEASE